MTNLKGHKTGAETLSTHTKTPTSAWQCTTDTAAQSVCSQEEWSERDKLKGLAQGHTKIQHSLPRSPLAKQEVLLVDGWSSSQTVCTGTVIKECTDQVGTPMEKNNNSWTGTLGSHRISATWARSLRENAKGKLNPFKRWDVTVLMVCLAR